MNEREAFEYLRLSGLRMTPLKRRIVRLFLSGGCGLSAGEVHSRFKGLYHQSSVFRCLKSLEEAGFLRPGLGSRGVVQYRCDRRFFPDHGHFLCRCCGDTIPLESALAGELVKGIEKVYGVEVSSIDFTLEGKCENCSRSR
ncbi:MAG TPA: transcriptional repressor [Candidatus Sabulitectum sp.]|nr:transcriptional repressor [Candidatus Sabulitectum sp.]HPF33018.1 transcriptional repressor [Candidatus Sabulitectum sp.]HPJ28469.1 transcriptional repressor [Candidatus Sabulitectum sp.]HPR23151.1 transcriptional repressor [Candidatus Sabulitectum sp.]